MKTRPVIFPASSAASLPLACAACTLGLFHYAHADNITWDSAGANDNWSTIDNWSDNATPAGDDITFNATGAASGSTVTNIVDTSFTVDSLNFMQSGTNLNHTVRIDSGITLSVTGGFIPTSGEATAVLFGQPASSDTVTNQTTFTGAGAFTVNNSANHFLVGYGSTASIGAVTVDMSGLASFSATVDIFGVGRKGTTTNARSVGGILRLSKASSITANQLSVGDTTMISGATSGDNNGAASTLYLGAGGSATTTINASTISLGVGKATGNMQFNTGVVSSDKVTIRGTSGGSSAVTTWDMGYRNMSSTSGTPSSTVNFGVGEVDAIIGSLNIARWGSTAGTSGVSPSATFSTGTNLNSVITVTTANLALNSGGGNPASAQTMNGTLNVQGGVFSATTVNLATGANQANLTRTATLNVDGGTFRFGTFGTPVGGYAINFKSGTVSSIDGTARSLGLAYNLGKTGGSMVTFGQASGGTGTIALNGAGTLVDATIMETLVNTTIGAGNLGGATSLTKTGAATLTLTGTLAASAVNVNVGTLSLGANDRLSNTATVTVAGGILDTTGSNRTDTVADFNMSSGSLNGGGTITAATYDLTGGTVNANLGTGAITVNTGTVALGSAARLNAASSLKVQSGQLTLAGAESVASYQQTGGTLAGTGHTLSSAATYDMQAGTVLANLGGIGIALNKTTAGTVTLSGNNSYSGGTTLSAGKLILGNSDALGSGSLALNSANSGTGSVLDLSGGINIGNTINIDTSMGRNNISSVLGANTLSGTLNYNNTAANGHIIANNASDNALMTVSGNINGATFASNISFRGTSTGGGTINSVFNTPSATFDINGTTNWTINSTGNNWGSVTGIISTGNLILGASDALDTSARLDHGAAGDLDLNGFNQTIAGLNRTTTIVDARITNNSATTDSIVTLSGMTADYTYANEIADGGERKVSLTMNSAGRTQTLSGTSTYTGDTVVSAGTLLVNGALGATNVTVNGGAFGGIGTVGGALDMVGGSLHVANLLNPLDVTGAVTIYSGFGIDDLTGLNWGSVSDGTYTLINGTLGSGVFAALANNSLATAYDLGGGRSAYFEQGSLDLVVIPEPRAALLGGLGLLALLRRRR